MSEDYTPGVSTGRVRGAATGEQNVAVTPEQFDRWLAAHDREVRVQALRDAADLDFEWEVFTAEDGVWSIRQHGKTPGQVLRDRADAEERGER